MMFIEKVKIFIESGQVRAFRGRGGGFHHKNFQEQVNRAHSKTGANPI